VRVALTIVLNGLAHLQHNDYAEFIVNNFDYWAIVEGATDNKGSTDWVQGASAMHKFHKDGLSIDGTTEFIDALEEKYPDKILIVRHGEGLWNSKDEMVNMGLSALEEVCPLGAMLWQIDVDEQWTLEQIERIETTLAGGQFHGAVFQCNQMVGKNRVAKGISWGNEWMHRLWKWDGKQRFISHEPPLMEEATLYLRSPEKFMHYSYYFPDDVKFKAKWYYNDPSIIHHWMKLQRNTRLPVALTALFPGEKYKVYTDKAIVDWFDPKEAEHNFEPIEPGKIVLLIPLFRHPLKLRRMEFVECIEKNIANPLIDHIDVFYQGDYFEALTEYPILEDHKIELCIIVML